MATDLQPIRTEGDYEAALSEVERLWGADLGTPDGDRLDILASLIDIYESHHHPVDPPDPIEAIKFRMEQQGLTLNDLQPLIGSSQLVADILDRRTGLSLDMIRRLHDAWGISADVLIKPVLRRDVA